MDSISCMAQQAKYFRTLDNIRNHGTIIYFHDETWVNSGEQRRQRSGWIQKQNMVV